MTPVPKPHTFERLQEALRLQREEGLSFRGACLQVGLSRGLALRLVAGGWAEQPLPPPPRSLEHRRVTERMNRYMATRLRTDPVYRLYRNVQARWMRARRRGDAAVNGSPWARIPGPRLREKRLVLRAEHLALLTEAERRLLWPAEATS